MLQVCCARGPYGCGGSASGERGQHSGQGNRHLQPTFSTSYRKRHLQTEFETSPAIIQVKSRYIYCTGSIQDKEDTSTASIQSKIREIEHIYSQHSGQGKSCQPSRTASIRRKITVQVRRYPDIIASIHDKGTYILSKHPVHGESHFQHPRQSISNQH